MRPRLGLRRRLRGFVGMDALEAEIETRLADERAGLLAELAAVAERAGDRAARAERRLAELEDAARIPTAMAWIARAEIDPQPLISVVMPTRDRGFLLGRAIASVIAQTYESWELVVVDDGSTDDTPRRLEEVGDRRVRSLRTEGRGVTAARNAALESATGSLIAYLDDDNLMHPEWLRAIAWAFAERPEAEVAYGAFVVDDPQRVGPPAGHGMPALVFERFDREALAAHNPADMSAIAHRAGLPEARFDERLSMYGDWELFARLTRHREPVRIPALACFYATDAPDRLSAEPLDEREHRAVLAALGRDASGQAPGPAHPGGDGG